MTMLGNNMEQMTYAAVQAAGENRIAVAAGVPAIVAGLKGRSGRRQLRGVRRRHAFCRRHHALVVETACQALEWLIDVPEDSRLWYDEAAISALRQGEKDQADTMFVLAQAYQALVVAGVEPSTAVTALSAGDITLVKPIPGFVSVPCSRALPARRRAPHDREPFEGVRLRHRDPVRRRRPHRPRHHRPVRPGGPRLRRRPVLRRGVPARRVRQDDLRARQPREAAQPAPGPPEPARPRHPVPRGRRRTVRRVPCLVHPRRRRGAGAGPRRRASTPFLGRLQGIKHAKRGGVVAYRGRPTRGVPGHFPRLRGRPGRRCPHRRHRLPAHRGRLRTSAHQSPRGPGSDRHHNRGRRRRRGPGTASPLGTPDPARLPASPARKGSRMTPRQKRIEELGEQINALRTEMLDPRQIEADDLTDEHTARMEVIPSEFDTATAERDQLVEAEEAAERVRQAAEIPANRHQGAPR